jgi:hypothetical protein
MFNFFKKKPIISNQEQGTSSSESNQDGNIQTTRFIVRYKYDWKEDIPMEQRDTANFESRPFCKKLMSLDRVYTRTDIQSISARLGYSVFDSCGGEGCRHRWVSVTLIEK